MSSEGAPMVTHKCEHCGVAAKNRCAKCQAVYYCSATCQKENWTTHKIICHPPPYKPSYSTPDDASRCNGCKGWGLGVVGDDGKCAHCRRVAAGETESPPA